MLLNQAIGEGSSSPIQNAAQTLKTKSFPNGCWLEPTNRYAFDTISRIKADSASQCVNDAQIAEYIAASVTLHCFDGWSFLAHAVGCILEGDVGGAVHWHTTLSSERSCQCLPVMDLEFF